MASQRHKSRQDSMSKQFLNLNSSKEINLLINSCERIMRVEDIPDEYITEVVNQLRRCIFSYTRKFLSLDSNQTRKEFRDASKRHQRTLNSILSLIIQSLITEGYNTYISFDRDLVNVNVNGTILVSEHVTPRSFFHWYNFLKIISKIRDISVKKLCVICRCMTTVYNLVNDTALRNSEKNSMTLELVSLLSNDPKYSTIDDFITNRQNSDPIIDKHIKDLKETIFLIKEYTSMNISYVPAWARDIVRSLQLLYRNSRLFIYDNIHPMMSLNSTCSSMKNAKGKRITIPGIFASSIEPDYFRENYPDSNFDSITGFKQVYKIDLDDLIDELSIKSKRRYSVSIDQKKPKPRIIHPLNNSEQDRLKYYHTLIEKVLIEVPSDCTFDQHKGPEHIKYVMENETKESIYSLDLTSATDTFNIGLQYLIIKELIFNNHEHATELSDTWLDIMKSLTFININEREIEFSFSNGQPQGFLSSFPAFSLEHHIVMLTVLRKFNGDITPLKFYRVLGDDSLITSYDPEFLIPGLYISYINAANVECNLTKGYLYNPDNPEYQVKIAEFAKYLLLDGMELTPFPFKLLIDTDNVSGNIALAAWYSNHSERKWSIENLKYFLFLWDEWYEQYYSPIIDTMVNLTIPGIFYQSFQQKLDRILKGFTPLDVELIQFLLFNTLMYSVIDKLIGNKDVPDGIDGLVHIKNELKPFLTSIQDTSRIDKFNKLSTLKLLITNRYYTFKELCSRYTSLSELDNETIELACMLILSNSSQFVQSLIEQLFDAMELLTIDPYRITNTDDLNVLANKMLIAYRNFSITVDRNWSNFGRHIPIDFLHKSIKEVDTLLKRKGTSVDEYVRDNEFIILPKRVESFDSDISGSIGSIIEGTLEEDYSLDFF
jgi:hypothetical protein